MDWSQVFGHDAIYTIYGPAMIGKTMLALNIAERDLKAGRHVAYIATELNLKPILDKIKPHVSELVELYDPMELWNWVDRLSLSKPTTVILDSIGGVRVNYIATYSKTAGGPPDTARINTLIQLIVHGFRVASGTGQLRVILIAHESPAISEFYLEDTYPTSARKALYDADIVIRILLREVTEGNTVKVARVGKVILDRYGVLSKDTLSNPIYFMLPEPLF